MSHDADIHPPDGDLLTPPSFGDDADWSVVDGGAPADADMEPEDDDRLAALRALAEAAARAPEPSPGDVAQLVIAALTAAQDLGDAAVEALAPADAILGRLADAAADDAARRLGGFTAAAGAWDARCKGLSDLEPAPIDLAEDADAWQHHVLLVERLATAADRAAHLRPTATWAATLSARLRAAITEADARLRKSSCRAHLWCTVLAEAADATLVGLLAARARATTDGRAVEALLATERSASLERLLTAGGLSPQRAAGGLIAAIMENAASGNLAAADMAAARGAIAEAPGTWAPPHRAALRRNEAAVITQLVSAGESWTVPAAFRAALPKRAVAGVVSLGPDESEAIEEHALARWPLALCGAEVALLGDESGCWAWYAVGHGARGRAARVSFTPDEATGRTVQVPVVALGSDGRRAPHLPARLGPFRALVAASGRNVDRAYSPIAHVLAAGDSVLRGLFGWNPRESSAALATAARRAGFEDIGALMDFLIGAGAQDPLAADWLRAMPLGLAARAAFDAATLGEWLDAPALGIPDPQRDALLGAELATLEGLPGLARPIDGDSVHVFVTRTASAALAGLLLRRILLARRPVSRVDLVWCDEMEQRSLEPHARHAVLEDAYERFRIRAAADVAQLMTADGADPIVLVTSGLKWQVMALTAVAMERRLPCAYKADHGDLVVFPWDRMPDAGTPAEGVAPHAGRPLLAGDVAQATADGRGTPAPGTRVVVVTVGTTLLGAWRGSVGASRDEMPDAAILTRWTLAQAEPWRASAELTILEAWRRHVATDDGVPVIYLIASRSDDIGKPDEGRACRDALVGVLTGLGMLVRTDDRWDVALLGPRGASGEDRIAAIVGQVARPIALCFDEALRHDAHPAVLLQGGQRLTCSLAQISATARGLDAWHCMDPEPGKPAPKPWRLGAASVPDESLEAPPAAASDAWPEGDESR